MCDFVCFWCSRERDESWVWEGGGVLKGLLRVSPIGPDQVSLITNVSQDAAITQHLQSPAELENTRAHNNVNFTVKFSFLSD